MTATFMTNGVLCTLFATAHHLRAFFGCTIESAILLCMANDLPLAQPPSDMTTSALRMIIANYGVPTNVSAILERFPGLPWREIRKQLIAEFAPQVRKQTILAKGFDPLDTPTLDLYPRFCASEAECQSRLTKAALSLARLLIDTERTEVSDQSTITWQHEPTMLELMAALYVTDPSPKARVDVRGDTASLRIRLVCGMDCTLSREITMVQTGTIDTPPTEEQWVAFGKPKNAEEWFNAGERMGNRIRLPSTIFCPRYEAGRPVASKLALKENLTSLVRGLGKEDQSKSVSVTYELDYNDVEPPDS